MAYNRNQRLCRMATPVPIQTEDGESFLWVPTRDAAGGRAIEAPPIERLYHGKVRGNDSGHSKRLSFYRKSGFVKSRPRRARAKTIKVESKVQEVEVIENEYRLRLTDLETGHVMELDCFAVDGATAIKVYQKSYPMYEIVIV